MMTARKNLGDIAASVASDVQQEDAPSPLAKAKSRQREKVKSTIYLDPAVHRQLKEIALEQGVRVHDLYMEGIDLVFKQLGLTTVAGLTKSK